MKNVLYIYIMITYTYMSDLWINSKVMETNDGAGYDVKGVGSPRILKKYLFQGTLLCDSSFWREIIPASHGVTHIFYKRQEKKL